MARESWWVMDDWACLSLANWIVVACWGEFRIADPGPDPLTEPDGRLSDPSGCGMDQDSFAG